MRWSRTVEGINLDGAVAGSGPYTGVDAKKRQQIGGGRGRVTGTNTSGDGKIGLKYCVGEVSSKPIGRDMV